MNSLNRDREKLLYRQLYGLIGLGSQNHSSSQSQVAIQKTIDFIHTFLEEAKAEYEKTRAEEVMEAARLASDLERNRVVKECKTKVVDYFAGSGELFFPYIEVGAETREEEIELAKNELEDLLESISAITNPKEGK